MAHSTSADHTAAFSARSVGGDVTAHVPPANLAEAYGRPWSVHLYARWALRYADRP